MIEAGVPARKVKVHESSCKNDLSLGRESKPSCMIFEWVSLQCVVVNRGSEDP